MNWST